MTTSLIISTYNWKEALKLCLLSVCSQTVKPDEVIIADDGSRPDTGRMIQEMQQHFPCPLRHIWQEDDGWRKCAILNQAFAASTGDYIIQIDGDIILHPRFIEDHISEARPNYFLVGSRSKITPKRSQHMLITSNYKITILSFGLRRRTNALRIPVLSQLFYSYKKNKKERGCNMSFWRKDLLTVNGYDERIKGYGYEDIDLPLRLRRAGVQKRFIKFKAIEFHIHHKEASTKKDMSANRAIFEENNRNRTIACEYGISQYL
jgi:glycosyltransferase involved in cell wall biosynthesis